MEDVAVCSNGCLIEIPFGKLTKNYGTSPFLVGKSTINAQCSIANC